MLAYRPSVSCQIFFLSVCTLSTLMYTLSLLIHMRLRHAYKHIQTNRHTHTCTDAKPYFSSKELFSLRMCHFMTSCRSAVRTASETWSWSHARKLVSSAEDTPPSLARSSADMSPNAKNRGARLPLGVS